MACAWHSSSNPNGVGLRVSILRTYKKGSKSNGRKSPTDTMEKVLPEPDMLQDTGPHKNYAGTKCSKSFHVTLRANYIVSTQGFLMVSIWFMFEFDSHREE